MQDTESDVKAHQAQFEKLKSAAESYRQELSGAGESLEVIESSMRQYERRWDDLNLLLSETKKKVKSLVSEKQPPHDQHNRTGRVTMFHALAQSKWNGSQFPSLFVDHDGRGCGAVL